MLGRQTAFGGILLVGSRLATRLLDLGTMLILARILRPADFGLVAIATSVVQVAEAVLELPLNQALLRLPDISRAQYDTAFTLGAARGLVLSFILFLAAWPLSQIYGDDRVFWLVCVLTVGPVMRGLVNPSFAHFHKNMSFWRDLIVELSGKLLSFTIGIALALLTDSYWAIAAGIIAFPAGITITSYVLKPYRPRFTLAELPVFSGFLGWITAAQVLSALNWQSERLLLGKIKSTAELGLFSAANDMANIPTLAVLVPLQRPLLAALAKLGNDRQRLAASYQTTSSAIVAIGLPVLVGESLLAEPAIRLVLGVKWLGAVPLLRWLPLSLIPALFTFAAIPLLMSINKTHVFFRRNLIEFCVKMPLLFAGAIAFGFPGVIFARAVSETVADAYSASVVRRLLGLSFVDQILVCWRGVLSTLVMVPPVMLCTSSFRSEIGMVENATNLIATASVGAAVYATASWLLWLLAGRPRGLEATAMNALTSLFARTRRFVWRGVRRTEAERIDLRGPDRGPDQALGRIRD